jgi:nitroreductase
MSITEVIKQRRSIRNYTGEPLKKEHADQILNYIAGLKSPFEGKARIELVHTHTGSEPVKLGTYGVISGASDFLVLVYEESDMGEENAAYLFEHVILFCTELGLGTCWSATFTKSNFAKQVELKPNEFLRIVSPVGYIKDKKRFVETLMGSDRNHKSRKPFKENFYDGYFDKHLTEDNAGIFREPLEMVRLAPSASNRQTWRVILNNGMLHFYHHESMMDFSKFDLGIALCHFDLTCKELRIAGQFEVLVKIKKISISKDKYSVTWIKATPRGY